MKKIKQRTVEPRSLSNKFLLQDIVKIEEVSVANLKNSSDDQIKEDLEGIKSIQNNQNRNAQPATACRRKEHSSKKREVRKTEENGAVTRVHSTLSTNTFSSSAITETIVKVT